MKKLILLLLAGLILIGVINNYKEDYYIIPDQAIRIRIIPNSNTPKDQFLKKQVKTNLEIELQNNLKNTETIENTRKIIKNNLDNYNKKIKEVLTNENTSQKFTIDYGYHHFPEKTYKGVKYEEGEYESLLVTLGKGQGDNWWCVLFPNLCLADLEQKDNTEYKSWVIETINKIF